ncbi:MAG: hypothetical protein ACLRIT_00300 [Blautia sp.]
MKSLFSENDIVLPEWLRILLETSRQRYGSGITCRTRGISDFLRKEKRIAEPVSSYRKIIR